jgi:uncharacterized protein
LKKREISRRGHRRKNRKKYSAPETDLELRKQKKEISPNELTERVNRILSELKKRREERERPLLDDKILTDWNGLMIAALARAGMILDEPSIERAEKAWSVIERHCWKTVKLLHRLKDGEAEIDGMADDYVFTVWG